MAAPKLPYDTTEDRSAQQTEPQKKTKSYDTVIAVALVVAGIWLISSCQEEPSRLGKMYQGPTGQVFFSSNALPDGRAGTVDSFEAQYAGKTYRGRLQRSGDSWLANLGGIPMNTSAGIEFRLLAGGQMMYQAYQSGVQFSGQRMSVTIDDCNVRVGWSGTLHQNSCRWTIR